MDIKVYREGQESKGKDRKAHEKDRENRCYDGKVQEITGKYSKGRGSIVNDRKVKIRIDDRIGKKRKAH